MKKSSRWISLLTLLLAASMLMSACGGSSDVKTGDYTFNTYASALGTNWNPHSWEMNSDNTILSYVSQGFVDLSVKNSEEGVYQWTYEMATSITDVTAANQSDLEKYAVTLPDKEDGTKQTVAETTEGYVFEIKLREGAKWEDGTEINADSYVYSMQQLLNPEMKNYRANNYIDGESAVAGGLNYYYSGSTAYLDAAGAFAMADLTKGSDGQYVNADGQKMYIGVAFALAQTGGKTLKDYVDAYGEAYFDVTNWNTLVGMVDENGLIPLTDENLALFAPVTTGNPAWGETEADLPNYFVYAKDYPVVEYEPTVGLYKVDDYTLHYVTQGQQDLNYLLTSMTSTWLVHEATYEANKDTTGKLVTSSYNTSKETTVSYGPYRIETLQEGKQLVFVQNENWWGWQKDSDGNLYSITEFEVNGSTMQQYQATKIVMDVMEDSAAKQAFLKGELDEWAPSADDLLTYGKSDNLYKADETYTQRLFFHTNLENLKKMDASMGNTNSVVLSNANFRKAFSLAINREEFVTATAGYKPMYGILNNLYFYDVYNDPESSYRKSDAAMQAICDLYGVEYGSGKTYSTLKDAYESINGYNLQQAQALMKTACEELVAAGIYTAGQDIVIRMGWKKAATMETSDNQQVKLLNDFINAAAEGSGFGTITLEAVSGVENRYEETAQGSYAIGYGAWGGAAFYPFSMFRVYCDPSYVGTIHEAGCWDPATETLTLNVEGSDVTMTWQEWSNSLTGTGVYANKDFETKLSILAELEKNYLGFYYCIPLCSTTSCTMLSYKVSYITEDYNIMYGWGGLRLATFNYTDSQWADYIAKGDLSYE